jgi:hypothetical protein
MVLATNHRGTSMPKLRTLLATALLTLPVLTLSASQIAVEAPGSGTRLESTSLTGCCWVFYLGMWRCYTC